MTLLPELPSPRWLLILMLFILALDHSLAHPQQQFFLAEDLITGTGTGSGTGTGTGTGTGAEPLIPVNDPSDLSAGLNLAPVGNLIAAAAIAVPPAPVQFIRTAMNSGL
ncbi:uncharacterized protein [Drosophila kikkawai]|uniref:Uncharacterized protein n=1 Tax=Drosophila kikkawai TaxID=30033 RepID=A0A6P4J0X3_DROKI|nr:uncharacterized protein LOC108079195 [Drosophila kikkawai]KAH8343132.1 hypothetical protein KR059_005460 [Drosophila kikkawai]